ncbi:ribosome-associated GTPase [Erysipelotrichaceae bacterium]|nr:ribosome-associated GTPase [Erysipelotrichaceae bacterium]
MLPIIAVVGRPNVGKSTLFNRIAQERISIVDDTKGVTRDRLYTRANWLGTDFILIDTGGLEQAEVPFMDQITLQAEIAMAEADVIIFVTNVVDGITSDDEYIANLLYRTEKPVIVATNFLDDMNRQENLYEFYTLGFEHVIGVSAVHGIGIGDLLEESMRQLGPKTDTAYDDATICFSLIGRPNVGKSSLVNTLLGEERVIVSEIAGTTRDAIDTPFKYHEKDFVVIDTAGIRRKGKVSEKVEKYSVLRALSAVERSNIVLIVIDATAGIQEQDKKIAGIAHEAGKGLIFVVNKWDAIEKDDSTMSDFEDKIRDGFKYADYAPIIYLSAKTKQRVHTLFPVLETVFENQHRRVSTSVLNEILQEAYILNPPSLQGQRRLKIFYGSQVSTEPPTFVLFINDEGLIHFSYKRYLENKIREAFDFGGTPIHIIFRAKKGDV